MSEQGQFEINDTILVPGLLGPEAFPTQPKCFCVRYLAGRGQADDLLGGGTRAPDGKILGLLFHSKGFGFVAYYSSMNIAHFRIFDVTLLFIVW